MKYQRDKQSAPPTADSATADSTRRDVGDAQLAELASEMRLLWRRMSRGYEWPAEVQALPRQQYWVLTALAAGPKRMSGLAECTDTSQASLTGIVDRLEEHGLVVRQRSADDRRVVEVALTEEGERTVQAADGVLLGRVTELVRSLTPAERTEFLRLMRKLTTGSGR